ncbi:MAG: hypothetical protein Q3983_06020 [Capnocytophaga sp.]|nr:hypothetical protein [Capnocytophaga sp.]
MKPLLLFILSISFLSIKAQKIEGFVFSEKDSLPIEGAILLDEKGSLLTYSDASGKFFLEKNIRHFSVSALGFFTKKINLSETNEAITLFLIEDNELENIHLEEVVVHYKTPTLREFSLQEMSKIEVYNNPNSYGDAIRATTLLPSSTATEESAEISIRGTGVNNSILFFNNVPIYKSFRGTDAIPGVGTFSVINTQTMKSLNVFSGNPPLYFGHSSGGLIETHTIEELKQKQISFSVNMSNLGGYFANKYQPNKESFFQIFVNHSFSDIFKFINKKAYPYINNFSNQDIGINTRIFLNKNNYLNFYSFAYNDNASFEEHIMTYKGDAVSKENRFLNILNFVHTINPDFFVQFNLMNDNSNSLFEFGNILSLSSNNNYFSSINMVYNKKKFGINIGADYDYRTFHFQGTANQIPFHYASTQPKIEFNEKGNVNHLQGFFVLKYKPFHKMLLSYSNRFSTDKISAFPNTQFSASYSLNSNHSFLFSVGNYSNYGNASYPNFIFPSYKSKQINLDFQNKFLFGNIDISLYYNKLETDEPVLYQWENAYATTTVTQNIFGAELLTDFIITKNIKWKNSLSIFSNKIKEESLEYFSAKNISPIIKSDFQYNIKPIKTTFNLSLSYRKGRKYTPILSNYTNNYMIFPIFGDKNSRQIPDYFKVDVNIYKILPLKSGNIIVYATLANILNKKNISKEVYEWNYAPSFRYYSGRMFFLGVNFNFL